MYQPSYYLVSDSKKRRKFTGSEDACLLSLVQSMGAREWNTIAKYMPDRTGRQCRDRYFNYLRPGFTNVSWTSEEDQILLQQYQIVGPSWSNIEKHLPGRSANSIKNRWNYYVSKHLDDMIPNNASSTKSVCAKASCKSVECGSVKPVGTQQTVVNQCNQEKTTNSNNHRTNIFNIDMSDLEFFSDCPPVFALEENEYFTVF